MQYRIQRRLKFENAIRFWDGSILRMLTYAIRTPSSQWPALLIYVEEILISQLTSQLTLYNHYRTDFWEFVRYRWRVNECAALLCVTWLNHVCDMTHSHLWHDSFRCGIWLRDMTLYMNELCHPCESFRCVTWFIQMCDMTHSDVWHDSFRCVTWLIQMCDMTHPYMWHDSFICVTWLIQMCDMTHPYMWHDSFRCVTWLIQMCDMTHPYMWHDSFRCVTWLIQMCDMTHPYVWHNSFRCVT